MSRHTQHSAGSVSPVAPRQVRCGDQHEPAHPTLGRQVAVLGGALWAVVAVRAEAALGVQVTHAQRRLGVRCHLVREPDLRSKVEKRVEY